MNETNQLLREISARSEVRESRLAAGMVAVCFVGIPATIAFVGWVLCIAILGDSIELAGILLILVFGEMLLITMSVLVGSVIGLAAQRIVSESSIPATRMAIAMALAFDGVLIGWFLVSLIHLID